VGRWLQGPAPKSKGKLLTDKQRESWKQDKLSTTKKKSYKTWGQETLLFSRHLSYTQQQWLLYKTHPQFIIHYLHILSLRSSLSLTLSTLAIHVGVNVWILLEKQMSHYGFLVYVYRSEEHKRIMECCLSVEEAFLFLLGPSNHHQIRLLFLKVSFLLFSFSFFFQFIC
jgi:hypothetical protein